MNRRAILIALAALLAAASCARKPRPIRDTAFARAYWFECDASMRKAFARPASDPGCQERARDLCGGSYLDLAVDHKQVSTSTVDPDHPSTYETTGSVPVLHVLCVR